MIRLLFILLIYSCSSSAPTGVKSTEYRIGTPPEKFKAINAENADYVFVHESNGSIILLNSLCKKYASTGLEVLTENILSGLKDLQIKSKTPSPYKERESINVEAEAKLDGVLVYIINKTFNRNHCTYDFAFISPKKKQIEDKNKFEQFINNISFK